MYTYLYLKDYRKANTAIVSYRSHIANCTFLTSAVCQKYYDEIHLVQLLLQSNEQDIVNSCREITEITKKVLM